MDFLSDPTVMTAYPYLATIVVLIYAELTSEVGISSFPSALAEAYHRESD
jgi:simple sugar transport system permease protein